MDEIQLSVIIPAYNAEKTIRRCLDSILGSIQQAAVEIVCVDDGSRDDTWQVLQQYAAQYSCMRIFHKENGGVGSARNLGLAKATGTYITWVDADDYVTDDWYTSIYEKLQQYQPDCLFFDYFYTQGSIHVPRHIALPEKVTLKDYVYEQSLENELKNFLSNQVIKAEIIKTAHFNETYHMLEDYDVLTQITPAWHTLIHIPRCLYHYVQQENSLTHTISADVLWNNIHVVKTRYDKYTALGLPVSMNDYVLQLVGYVYSDSIKQDPSRMSRMAQIRKALRDDKKDILHDKGIPAKVKIKVICAMMAADGVLKAILRFKRRY